MEEFYNIWNYDANEALFTEENIAIITAAEPKGKNFRLDYLEIVRTIPGLGIHPNIVPRKKKLSDVKQGEDDNPDALFDQELLCYQHWQHDWTGRGRRGGSTRRHAAHG